MLPEDLQECFRRLGAFGGSFDLDAAAAVVGDDVDPLDALDELVDVSLVTVDQRPAGEPRFRLLRTMWVFARRRLEESGELDPACRRHGEHYVALAERLAPQLSTGQQFEAKDRIREELDNLRAVLDWTLPVTGSAAGDRVLGLRLCQSLYRFWYTCGYQAEGRHWLGLAVASSDAEESPELATALQQLGVLLLQHGETLSGRDALQRALNFWRRHDEPGKTVGTLSSLAIAHRALEEPELARQLLVEAVELARAHGEKHRLAAALSNLAIMDVDEQQPAAALERLTEALELDRERDDEWAVVADQLNMTAALLELGRVAEAHDRAQAIAEETLSLEDPDMTAALFELLAWIFAELDDPHRAARMAGAATAVREKADLPMDAADAALLDRSLRRVRRPGDDAAWAADMGAGAGMAVPDVLEEAFATAGGTLGSQA
jgi:tetratricopeptide (TPR) repeat protein